MICELKVFEVDFFYDGGGEYFKIMFYVWLCMLTEHRLKMPAKAAG